MEQKFAIYSQIDADSRSADGDARALGLASDAVAESVRFELSATPHSKKPVIFENWEDIQAFCKRRKLYPVVQKREESFVLIKAFAELAEARRFIQKNTRRGPHYVLWYTPGVF